MRAVVVAFHGTGRAVLDEPDAVRGRHGRRERAPGQPVSTALVTSPLTRSTSAGRPGPTRAGPGSARGSIRSTRVAVRGGSPICSRKRRSNCRSLHEASAAGVCTGSALPLRSSRFHAHTVRGQAAEPAWIHSRSAASRIRNRSGQPGVPGTHGELLGAAGGYARLFTLQAEGYRPAPDAAADSAPRTEPVR